jgi:FkbM family methyltransferase
MCAKLSQAIGTIIPEGPLRELFKSSYYRFYYNAKHSGENGFRVYYSAGKFRYVFDEGIDFVSPFDLADEIKRSLKGYLAVRPLRAGDVVIDCGACLGEFTLYAAKAVGGSGRVVAFEPDSGYYDMLVRNIEANGLRNVTAINKGVWSSDGELAFTGDPVRGYTFMRSGDDPASVSVSVVSLDAEAGRLGMRKVDFIKMDVEGAELEAIRGAGAILRQNDAAVAVASYHMVDGEKCCGRVERALAAAGYRAWTANEGHLTTYGKKGGAA